MRGIIIGDLLGSSPHPNLAAAQAAAPLAPSAITPLSVATATALLRNVSYAYALRHAVRTDPLLQAEPHLAAGLAQPEQRISRTDWLPPIWASLSGWAFGSLGDVEDEAEAIAAATHSHPETLRAARATAACVLLLRSGASPKDVRHYLEGVGYRTASLLERVGQIMGTTAPPTLDAAPLLPLATQIVLSQPSFAAALDAALAAAPAPSPLRASLAGLVGALAEARGLALPDPALALFAHAADPATQTCVQLFAEQYQPT